MSHHRVKTCRSTVILAVILVLWLVSCGGPRAFAAGTEPPEPAPCVAARSALSVPIDQPLPESSAAAVEQTVAAVNATPGPTSSSATAKPEDVDQQTWAFWKPRVIGAFGILLLMVMLLAGSQDGSKDGRIQKLRELRDTLDEADGEDENVML